MKVRFLAFVLALAFCAPALLAQDKPAPKTPEQIKQEQKDKDFKKAKEDLEKELTKQKVNPAVPSALLQQLAYPPCDLEVKQANELVHHVLKKKVPIVPDVTNAIGELLKLANDPKKKELDKKKFVTELKKWIDAWKPAPPPADDTTKGGKGGKGGGVNGGN